jgi:hypothetical protein
MDEFIHILGKNIEKLVLPDQCQLLFYEGELLPKLYFCFKDLPPRKIIECNLDSIQINPIPSQVEAENKEIKEISWKSGLRTGSTESLLLDINWFNEEDCQRVLDEIMRELHESLTSGGWLQGGLSLLANVDLTDLPEEPIGEELPPASEDDVSNWLKMLNSQGGDS